MNDVRSRINDVLALERIDDDIYRGRVIPSTLTRTFGGQVASQSLVAATQTVAEGFRVHSLHGYFVAPGNSDEPTTYLVDRVRDGRSFVMRSVKAIQNGHAIFIMQASFHHGRDAGPEHADRMRDVPAPEDVVVDPSDNPPVRRALFQEWSDWDIRVVPPENYRHDPDRASQQVVWFRTRESLPDDDTVHVCTLAYMSDMTLLSSALVPHQGQTFQEASLDHAMWFLRPFRADEWLLYDQTSPSAHAGRALTHGRIFNRQGELVAVVTQEGLTRALEPSKGGAIPFRDGVAESADGRTATGETR